MVGANPSGVLTGVDAVPVSVEVRVPNGLPGFTFVGRPLPGGGLIERPPFRAPRPGVSPVVMIGGRTTRKGPGEISLATEGFTNVP